MPSNRVVVQQDMQASHSIPPPPIQGNGIHCGHLFVSKCHMLKYTPSPFKCFLIGLWCTKTYRQVMVYPQPLLSNQIVVQLTVNPGIHLAPATHPHNPHHKNNYIQTTPPPPITTHTHSPLMKSWICCWDPLQHLPKSCRQAPQIKVNIKNSILPNISINTKGNNLFFQG